MSEQDTTATPEKTPDDANKGKTIAESIGEQGKGAKMVPESALLKYKSEVKRLKKDLKKATEVDEDDESEDDESEDDDVDIDTLAEENNVDKTFLKKFSKTIAKSTEKNLEKLVAAKIKPFEDIEKGRTFDAQFKKAFSEAMAEMPQYEKVVNEKVIKSLSQLPENRDKTFQQLLDETYGNAVPGKRSLETQKPGGGRAPESVDIAKASRDPKYFDEIMKDPQLKKEYNDNLMERLQNSL